jgi:hypothetical protein
MANESHLSVLKQGVESWNQWREQDRNIKPDLSEADLPRVNLSGAALWGVDLSQANLRWANLSEADLWGADLTGANLSGAELICATLSETFLDGSDFGGARIASTIFGGVDLSSSIGLDSVRHRAPSTLGVDSIILSKGEFLRLSFAASVCRMSGSHISRR